MVAELRARLADAIDAIERGEDERPEFELTHGSTVVALAAVYLEDESEEEAEDETPAGWVVSVEGGVLARTDADDEVVQGLYCGAPHAVLAAALFEREAVLSLVPAMLGETVDGVCLRGLEEVVMDADPDDEWATL